METVLVTGNSGYLGGCVFSQLAKTRSVHRLPCRLEKIEKCSLTYDIVVHCAGALRYRSGQHKTINAKGTQKLIDGLKSKPKFIYISSKSVYGIGLEGDFTELDQPHPTDAYGISKYEGELEVIKSGLPYIILRSSTLFGLGVDNIGQAFPSTAMQRLYHGKDIDLFSPDVLQEYLYVFDLAVIIQKLLNVPDCWNNVFNASGPKRSLHDLINTMHRYVKTNTDHAGSVIRTRSKPYRRFYLDSSKLENLIGEKSYTPDDIIVDRMGTFFKNKGSC